MIKQLFFYDIENKNSNESEHFCKVRLLAYNFIFCKCLNFSSVKKIVKINILTILRFVIRLSPVAYVYHKLQIFIYNKNVDFKYSDKKQSALKINTKSQLSTTDNQKEKYLKYAKNLFSENKE